MADDLTRRGFLGVAGATAAGGAIAAASAEAAGAEASPGPIKIVAICASPRKGMSTATTLKVALEAAREVEPDRIEVELIELADMKINANLAAGIPLEPGERDDFPSLVPKLADPKVAGIVIGTPVYFSNMTALCKAFLDRCIAFRKDNFALRNKVAGVIAVGAARNGGQLLAVESVQAALYCQDMIVVQAGAPTTRSGAAVWNQSNGEVTDDETGMEAAKAVGRKVAEVALQLGKA
jgi:multimeric flavodoxin WrbA